MLETRIQGKGKKKERERGENEEESNSVRKRGKRDDVEFRIWSEKRDAKKQKREGKGEKRGERMQT